jgi:hypothetical protein
MAKSKKKKRVVRKRTVRRVTRRVVKQPRRKKSASSKVSYHKKQIQESLDKQLGVQLLKRDKATTYKQHRAAQSKIDNIRRALRGAKSL